MLQVLNVCSKESYTLYCLRSGQQLLLVPTVLAVYRLKCLSDGIVSYVNVMHQSF